MDEFVISHSGIELAFFDREPSNRAEPLDYFSVRFTQPNLSAQCRVSAYYSPDLAVFFAEMARQWGGWQGELEWSCLEYELKLQCRNDGLGHISIRADLSCGPMPDDWRVRATFMADAGQLEGLAKRAALFFGEPNCL
ncbi:MAG: DUF6228 family protein [Pirellulaceae bacterium]